MALLDSTARRQAPEPVPVYRTAPHNIEAEQALLGAILINNEALYRVSDFLEPGHFFERLHQTIFELSSSLIRSRRAASSRSGSASRRSACSSFATTKSRRRRCWTRWLRSPREPHTRCVSARGRATSSSS